VTFIYISVQCLYYIMRVTQLFLLIYTGSVDKLV